MTTTNINPATEDLSTILANQRLAFLRDGPPTLEQRRDLLHAPFTKNTDRIINLFLR